MTHKLKTEMFSQKIGYSGGVFVWPLTPLFSFVSFHLKHRCPFHDTVYCLDKYNFMKHIMRKKGNCSPNGRKIYIAQKFNTHRIAFSVQIQCFEMKGLRALRAEKSPFGNGLSFHILEAYVIQIIGIKHGFPYINIC